MNKVILVIILLVLAVPVYAEDVQIDSLRNNMITELHPAPGVIYRYDHRGNSVTIYDNDIGTQWYSQQNRYGRIQSQGYVFEPLGPQQLLRVPDSMRYVPQPSR